MCRITSTRLGHRPIILHSLTLTGTMSHNHRLVYCSIASRPYLTHTALHNAHNTASTRLRPIPVLHALKIVYRVKSTRPCHAPTVLRTVYIHLGNVTDSHTHSISQFATSTRPCHIHTAGRTSLHPLGYFTHSQHCTLRCIL